jgi:hypothetical protein
MTTRFPSTAELAPWQMTSAEWNRARGDVQPNGGQTNFTKTSGSEAVSAIERLEVLLFGVRDEAKRKLQAAQRREITVSADELEAIDDELRTRVCHQDVIAKAVREGRPVPEHVLAEYPELKEQRTADPLGVNEPVRVGDVFQAPTGEAVTVIRQRPGGIVEVRFQAKLARLDNFKSTRLGDFKNNELKAWPKIGRANFQDGFYTTPQDLIDMAAMNVEAHAEAAEGVPAP